MKTFAYTVSEVYTPSPMEGTIQASSKEEAYAELVDIYAYELSTDEESLTITLNEVK